MIRHFKWAPNEKTLASFSVETGGILLRCVTLRIDRNGGFKMSPPKFGGQAAFVVPPDIWAEVQDAAVARYERHRRSLTRRPAVIAAG